MREQLTEKTYCGPRKCPLSQREPGEGAGDGAGALAVGQATRQEQQTVGCNRQMQSRCAASYI